MAHLHVPAPKSFDFSSDRVQDPHGVFFDGANRISVAENVRRIKCAVK